jgi:hypothetical protein
MFILLIFLFLVRDFFFRFFRPLLLVVNKPNGFFSVVNGRNKNTAVDLRLRPTFNTED